eukprot:6181590-Pleurochrysis_carterae.AAC.3
MRARGSNEQGLAWHVCKARHFEEAKEGLSVRGRLNGSTVCARAPATARTTGASQAQPLATRAQLRCTHAALLRPLPLQPRARRAS